MLLCLVGDLKGDVQRREGRKVKEGREKKEEYTDGYGLLILHGNNCRWSKVWEGWVSSKDRRPSGKIWPAKIHIQKEMFCSTSYHNCLGSPPTLPVLGG